MSVGNLGESSGQEQGSLGSERQPVQQGSFSTGGSCEDKHESQHTARFIPTGSLNKETGRREAPVPTFFLRSVPVYEEQDPFQHYDFTSVAGRGGYATVYTVQHLESGERSACKVVHTKGSPEYVERALKEACMQSILSDHPNVTTLKEVWTFGLSHVFLVMDQCEGGEIFDAIASRGALPERDAASILRVVLQLIRYCHSKGIIHHDLKPENFLCKDKERGLEKDNIRIVDFGCTAFYDEATRKLSGTPLYAAPEIIKGPHHDYRADLWSAGVFLYCMLTGLMPFEGESNQEMKQAVLSQPINFEEDPWPFVADEAKDLCRRLLQRDPEDRISLDDAMTHPWSKQHCLDEPEDDSEAIDTQLLIAQIQSFSSKSRLQRLLVLLSAQRSGPKHEDHAAYLRFFNWMDVCGVGALSLHEFKSGLLQMKADLSEAEIEELLTNIPQISRGKVTFEEFRAASIDVQTSFTSLDDFLDEHLKSPQEQCPQSFSTHSLCALLPNFAEDDIKLVVDDLADQENSEGHPSISREALEAAWQDCLHPFSSSGSTSLNDAVNLELEQMWQRGSLKVGHDHDHASVAGSSPVAGGSPRTESSWDRMMLVRGGSPATIGSEHELGSSPPGASSQTWLGPQIDHRPELGGKDTFCSGGIMYWDGHPAHGHWEEEEEDSDNLFGPALTAVQTRHP